MRMEHGLFPTLNTDERDITDSLIDFAGTRMMNRPLKSANDITTFDDDPKLASPNSPHRERTFSRNAKSILSGDN